METQGSTSFPFFGIDVEFPYKTPYNSQRAIMATAMKCFIKQQNGLLESPTGTGKTLALLASSLAYQDHVQRHPNEGIQFTSTTASQSDFDEGPVNQVPQIWYTSRTHTQLKQLYTELKRLSYTPQLAYLASRDKLCINQDVRKSNHIERECRIKHRVKHACVFGAKGGSVPREFRKDGELGKFEIEDLIDYCREHNRCPYLISREMMKMADLIIAPYNYVVDPDIRKQMNLNLNGQILIIDEAHNIESVCRDAAGLRFTMEDLRIAMANSDMRGWEQIYPTLVGPCSVLYGLFDKMMTFIIEKRQDFKARKMKQDYLEIESTAELLAEWGISSRSWPKLEGDFQAIKKADDVNSNPNEGDRFPSEALTLYASRLHRVLNAIFKENAVNIESFKIIYSHSKKDDDKEDAFEILCLDPSVLFKDLARTSHSVVLSSGTLTPMSTFATELGVQFQSPLSAPHVINASQIQSFALAQAPNRVMISSTASALQRQKDDIYQGLGMIFEELIPRIPDGVLLFVPSYGHLNDLVTNLKRTGMWDRLRAIKPIFVEKEGKWKVQDYTDAIDSGKGAFLMAVCRGQLSEGIDFTDRYARAVFAFGIPFGPFMQPGIALKRKYNEDQYGPKEGNNWYEADAYRSLFQAVGRCIRHVRDYGAVILLDERFSKEISRFPNWLKGSFASNVRSVSEIARSLEKFYAQMEIDCPMSTKTTTTVDHKAPFTITCSCCANTILSKVTINEKAGAFCSSKGFMNAVDVTTGQNVVIIRTEDEKQLQCEEKDLIWAEADGVGYKPIVCKCQTIVGVTVHAVSQKTILMVGERRILMDRARATQGRISRNLDEIVEKPKVMGLSKESIAPGGQALLSFGKV